MNPAMLSMLMPVLTKMLNGGKLDGFLGGEQAETLKAVTGGKDITPEDQVLAAIATLASYMPAGNADYAKAVNQILEGLTLLRGSLR